MERSGFRWQRHLFGLADIDRRIKENRRPRDQAQQAMASSSSSGVFAEVALLKFIRKHEIATLNVAVSLASKESEVGAFVKRVLEATFFP